MEIPDQHNYDGDYDDYLRIAVLEFLKCRQVMRVL